MQDNVRICFIGDVIGRTGRDVLSRMLPRFKDEETIDLCIANGENAAGGFGITPDIADQLFSYGVDLITTGNHVWDRKEIIDRISQDRRILRPANYPEETPGHGSGIAIVEGGIAVGVINIQGRIYLPSIDCPFKVIKREITKVKSEARIIIVDMHAEATSEKIAMGYYLDGEVSAVIGTHTHVQTADEHILPRGTAYITDVGMTGDLNSIIGMQKDIVIRKFLTQMPVRHKVSKGEGSLCGVILDIDPRSALATGIRRFQISQSGN